MQFTAGEWYINVHTQANPNGEIRGQVLPGWAKTTRARLVEIAPERASGGRRLAHNLVSAMRGTTTAPKAPNMRFR
jgi:CHRD domain